MIELHQFAPNLGVPNPSPFCLKVETMFKLSGLAYSVTNVANVAPLPKSKAPVIVDDGEMIADSTFITEHLKNSRGIDLDAGLTPSEKAVSWAMRVMLEERTYWTLVHSRWFDEQNWQVIRRAFFGGVPRLIRKIIENKARETIRRNMIGHGIGRHTTAEIESLGVADIDALAAFLADKPFMMGSQVTLLDATAFGLLANVFSPELETFLKAPAEKHGNLVAYTDRMMGLFVEERQAA